MVNRVFLYRKTAAPTVNDDTGDGYKVGDMWLDTTNDIIYQTIDVTAGAAIWQQLSGLIAFKNRIINGRMEIDQRNVGAAVTVNSAARTYGVDRFFGYGQATDGVFTMQCDTVAPAGFINSLKVTVTTADASVGASQFYYFGQSIEGLNCTDLAFGSASAKTITLSFWVRSSVTGTFGGALLNSAANRSYPFTYSISSSNTWEQKTVTIAGDTSGTWLTTNGIGLNVVWDLGCGSSNLGTAGAWVGAADYGATGGTKLISTLNATWYITGVQVEVGSAATAFEVRQYGAELALCQRYFQKSHKQSTKPGTSVGSQSGGYFYRYNQGNDGYPTYTIFLLTIMRAAPSITFYDNAGASGKMSTFVTSWTDGQSISALSNINESMFTWQAGNVQAINYNFDFTAASEL